MSSTKNAKSSRKFILAGVALILTGLAVFYLTFSPVIKEEVRYTLTPPKTDKTLVPLDPSFDIIIPKIGANAKVVPNVDPYNEPVYQRALTQGVAHAKGTSLPYQNGNVFIFAHSAGNFYEANRFNAVFYLLTKLEKGDEIDVYYQNTKYRYEVTDKKLVDPAEVSYLTGSKTDKTLTLMTCWPAGTTLKRLIVLAKLSD